MVAVMNDPEMSALYEDPAWILNENLLELADSQLLAWTLGRDKQQAVEEAQAGGWPITAVNRHRSTVNPHFSGRVSSPK